MRKVCVFCLSFLAIFCGYSQNSIGVLFNRVTQCPPNIIVMDIPIHHTPVWLHGTDIWENYFVFNDSSYIYFIRSGMNPNYSRLKTIGDSLFRQRFEYASYDYYNPCGDSLFSIEYEGVDSSGLCWKDVHYLFPDSLCVVKEGSRWVQTWKHDRFRVTVGYARVPPTDKDVYDKSLASFKMVQLSDSDSSYIKLLDSSFGYNSRFRYLGEWHGLVDEECHFKIDIYKESMRK